MGGRRGGEEDGEQEVKKADNIQEKTSKKPTVTIALKRIELTKKLNAAAGASSPSGGSEGSSSPQPKKRGRPSRAEMERRAKEKAEREARGEVDEPEPEKGPKKR